MATEPDTVIHCQGLVKHYGPVKAVDGLDLVVRRGECLGLLGPNGAGKTTTVEILEGLIAPDQGTVTILGQAWGRGDQSLRERLGVQLQETRLAERLTVQETVALFRSFYRRGRPVDEVVALLGLEAKRHTWIVKLSGGQRQRVALACALVSAPEILFLDEPTTGLDPQARRRIWEVVETYLKNQGTVLLTTHYMEEAARLCDRVAVIDQGRAIALDTPQALVASLGGTQIVTFETDGALAPGLLENLPGVQAARAKSGRHRLTVNDVSRALSSLLALLTERGLTVQALTTHEATLEDVFLHLTGRELRDG